MVVVASAQSPAAGAPKVLLLSGKPAAAAAAAAAGAPAGRALPLMVPDQRGASPEAASGGPPQARKRQRLTHLSPEEKALRRKLKNRVAAQTARDRKKARMSELEQQVVDLEEENQKLLLENQLLREKTHGLVVENQELRQRLGMDALVTEEEAETQTKGNGARPVAGSAERSTQTTCTSAAGAGPVVTPPEHLPMDSDGVDSSDSESDILLGILFNLDPVMFFRCPSPESTSLEEQPEVYPEGPSSLPASSSPSLGTSSAKLEAINELIRFDHVYTKPLVLEIPSETESQANVVVKIEEAPFSPSEKDHPEFTVSVKEELVEDDFIPELGTSDLLSPSHCPKPSSCLLDAYSDCGYEGSPSPFSDMSSLLGVDHSWEDTFANELFPQLISV
ncbi:LOW QUALITY PROTEIN: X-box-binding protein 1 [Panthera pardus]|uniref:X-box-binding protein 1 n=1 Tax=Panthera pardus TaxID=9691 RepID=A0A9V1EHV5_PANPR|nr:LOW QUALITY PROTEIN: X-box-binding protein 1 [Panthera pardus]XP_042818631.1 LOW QUALITY PROTEIN: X-box-binding protein 1 [Panthera tigris]